MSFALRHACRLWGIKLDYTDTDGKLQRVSDETLRALLSEVTRSKTDSSEDLKNIVRKAHELRAERFVEPVIVHWVDANKGLSLCVTPSATSANPIIRAQLKLEKGDVIPLSVASARPVRKLTYNFRSIVRFHVEFDGFEIPSGYHDLQIECGKQRAVVKVFAAKTQTGANAYLKPENKHWGLFVPLYGLKRKGDWGIGDLTAMEKTLQYVRDQGGAFVGTLPMLAAANEGTDWDPSPYSPYSRLFWNEIYLDVEALARTEGSEIKLPELRELQQSLNVDHARVMELKRQALRTLAGLFFLSGGEQRPAFVAFLERNPLVREYAKFRSGGSRESEQYHLYVQFRLDEQLREIKSRAIGGKTAGLYLDFPVGVARDGFDSAYFCESFLNNVNAGAPPDQLFAGGQDWGFAPLHPIAIRESHYDYFIRCIRHHVQYASVLRLDHIMAFHRIYAIPHGMGAKAGGYIRYRADEFYALLSIEAERAGTRIVGEDLGTVPDSVRKSLKEHDCLRMWVLPFEVGNEPARAAELAPERSIACLNTHDMAPFAGHCASRDLHLFEELGVLDNLAELGLAGQRRNLVVAWSKNLNLQLDQKLELATFARFAFLLAQSRAELVLINAEDLWLETEPQNIPGTWKQYPNWRKKLRFDVETWQSERQFSEFFRELTKLRSQAETGKESQGGNTKRNEQASVL